MGVYDDGEEESTHDEEDHSEDCDDGEIIFADSITFQDVNTLFHYLMHMHSQCVFVMP